jgi:hypothetical protein
LLDREACAAVASSAYLKASPFCGKSAASAQGGAEVFERDGLNHDPTQNPMWLSQLRFAIVAFSAVPDCSPLPSALALLHMRPFALMTRPRL